MASDVIAAFARWGMNFAEDKWRCFSTRVADVGSVLHLDNKLVTISAELEYLGCIVSCPHAAVQFRIRAAWKSFWANRDTLLCSAVGANRRLQLLMTLVFPVLSFACSSWIWGPSTVQTIRGICARMTRMVLKLTKQEGESWQCVWHRSHGIVRQRWDQWLGGDPITAIFLPKAVGAWQRWQRYHPASALAVCQLWRSTMDCNAMRVLFTAATQETPWRRARRGLPAARWSAALLKWAAWDWLRKPICSRSFIAACFSECRDSSRDGVGEAIAQHVQIWDPGG